MKTRNKIIIIISSVFLLLAAVFVILGFALAGNDVLAWFGSKWAMWVYTIVGMWLLFVAFIYTGDLIKRRL